MSAARKTQRQTGILAIALAGVAAWPGVAQGQGQPTGRRTVTGEPIVRGFSMTASPARLTVPAGEIGVPHEIRVINTGTETQRISVRLADVLQGRSGSTEYSKRPGPGSGAKYIRAQPLRFTLRSGRLQAVRLAIEVPSNAESGERSVGVLFTAAPPPRAQTGTSVRISRQLAVQVLYVVPGPVVRKVAFGGLDGPLVADGGPVQLTLPVKNQGNIHRDFFHPGSGLFADTGDGRKPISIPDFTVLRASERDVRFNWDDPPLFCICTVTVRTTNGQGKTVETSKTVWVIPVRLVLGVLLALTGLTLLTRQAVRRQRRRTALALAHARAMAYREAQQQGRGPPADESD